MLNRHMFTHPLPSATSASLPASGAQAPPGAGFAQVLASAMDSTPVDPVDEEKALQELFHILASLSCGQVDYPAASEEGKGTPGPCRREVEALKEVIRRLMGGGTPGKPGKDDPTLEQLFQSLPPEIRNLLLRAFPRLKDLLREESGAGKQVE